MLPEGFGFVGPPVKYGSLKPGVQLAAKPSLFDEESKPEKKIDMFSMDSDDEMKDGEKDETKHKRKEDSENATVKVNNVILFFVIFLIALFEPSVLQSIFEYSYHLRNQC